MDKQTLSNYGWVVIVTLILAVMLALATPFGNYAGDAVVNITNGFVGTSNDSTDKDNISQESVEWAVKTDHGIDYNTYKYFKTLDEAIDAVNNNNYSKASTKLNNNNIIVSFSRDGSTPVVRLLNDIKIKETITIKKDMTLDLNAHTISAKNMLTLFEIKSNFTCMSVATGYFNTEDCLYIMKNLMSTTAVKEFVCKNITFNYDADVTREKYIEMGGTDDGIVGDKISGGVIRIMGEENNSTVENCKFYVKGHTTYPLLFAYNKNISIKNCYMENKGSIEQTYNLGLIGTQQTTIKNNQFIVNTTYDEREYEERMGEANEPCNIRILNDSKNTLIENNDFKVYATTNTSDFKVRATNIRIVTQYNSEDGTYHYSNNTSIKNNTMYIEADNSEYAYSIYEKGRSQNTILLNNIATIKTNNTDINNVKLFRFGSIATYTDTNNTFTIK